MLSRKEKQQKKKTIATFGQFILPLTIIVAFALVFFSVKLFFNSTPVIIREQEAMEQEDREIKQLIKSKIAEKKNAAAPDKTDNVGLKQPEKKQSEQVGTVINQPTEGQQVQLAAARPVLSKISANSAVQASQGKQSLTVVSADVKNRKKYIEKETLGSKTDQKVQVKTDRSIKRKNTSKQAATNRKEAVAKTVKKKNANEKKILTGKTVTDNRKNADNKTHVSASVQRQDIQIGVFSDKKNAEKLVQKAKEDGFAAYLLQDKNKTSVCYKVKVKGAADRKNVVIISENLKKKGYVILLPNKL